MRAVMLRVHHEPEFWLIISSVGWAWGFINSLGIWDLGWDYMKNYAWRDSISFWSLSGVVSDLNELLSSICEFSQLRSDSEKVAWMSDKYKQTLRVSQSIFLRLLSIFSQIGPLHELVLTVQKEVMEGELLRDCIELGADDLKGLVEVVKDIAFQYLSTSHKTEF